LFGVFSGAVPFATSVTSYIVPVLAGNTIGGVVFVAVLNHLQIASDYADCKDAHQPQ
jgi:formate/nitrite transporter FocA (FNT family)